MDVDIWTFKHGHLTVYITVTGFTSSLKLDFHFNNKYIYYNYSTPVQCTCNKYRLRPIVEWFSVLLTSRSRNKK